FEPPPDLSWQPPPGRKHLIEEERQALDYLIQVRKSDGLLTDAQHAERERQRQMMERGGSLSFTTDAVSRVRANPRSAPPVGPNFQSRARSVHPPPPAGLLNAIAHTPVVLDRMPGTAQARHVGGEDVLCEKRSVVAVFAPQRRDRVCMRQERSG